MYRYFYIVIFVLMSQLSFSQTDNRQFVAFSQEDDFYKIDTNDGHYLLRFFNDYIVENNFIPKNETYNPQSEAVILNTNMIPEIIQSDNSIDFITGGLCVTLKKKPFQWEYYYNDRFLISEKDGYQANGTLMSINFNIDKDDVLYGGGNRVLGMNRRGHKLKLYNRAHYGYETKSELMNYTMPLVVSSKKFGVLFDNAPIGYLDLDSQKNNTITYETISGRMTYQIIATDTWEDYVVQFTALTGRQSLPPRWAFGNFASRFGYHSQAETEKTVALFKEKNIPLDAVVLDIYWFGKTIFDEMGNLKFYRDSFPEPEQMIKNFKAQKIHTVLVTEPFILTTSDRWDEAVKEDILVKDSLGKPKTWDFYFGNTSLIDLYNPKGRQWFWNIYKHFTQMGIDGWWGDLGEPEVHPSDALHMTATADEIHNIYGHDWAKLIYKGYQRDFPHTRPFILMRAGAVGSQRYGMIPWTGDVNRSWGGLQVQPELALQMGLQGIGYMHSDLGGFAGANLDDELYVRWLQYGVFQPIFRPHAQEEVPSEPVYRSPKVQELSRTAINLRYRLLPYLYTLAFNNQDKGLPLMRPLFFYDDNPQLLTYKDAYLWGRDMLIAPVMKADTKTQEVYFPKDSHWYDFYTFKSYDGGQIHDIPLHEKYIPTFVRGGAFIPMTPVFQNTEDYNIENLEVHFFNDPSVKQSAFEMYHDDGKTPEALKTSKFEMLTFSSESNKKSLKINIKQDYGIRYQPYKKNILLVVHNLNKKLSKVKINGKKVKFDQETDYQNILIIPVTIEEYDVSVKFVY
ncbi:MAG: glycosyl hydrolase [Flavobacteriia bacterium]|nr:MAG: glycosyl hydrolase [Flavobacteriia bacterium]